MRKLEDKIYHGCGHVWMIANLFWDDGAEVIQYWYYIK